MNQYSALWFKTFLETIPNQQTEKEIAFIVRHLPQPRYKEILDLCCGEGRHAHLLAVQSYRVTGVDCNASVIEIARSKSEHCQFLVGDMREIYLLREKFDAVICLWQSFGDFDDVANADVIKQIADKLEQGGRFILDIFHRGFFETRQGTVMLERNGRTIIERKWMIENRLIVKLDYQVDGITDYFDRRLYVPDEIANLCAQYGLIQTYICTDFDESKPATSEKPRMQMVFEKQ